MPHRLAVAGNKGKLRIGNTSNRAYLLDRAGEQVAKLKVQGAQQPRRALLRIKVDETELPHLLQLSPTDAQALIARAKSAGQMDQLLDAARRTKALEAVVSECNCTYVQESEAEAKKRLGEMAAVMQHREELARKAASAAEKDSSTGSGANGGSGLKLV